MFLAGDVGGTKALLGLFRPGRDRPTAQVVREYATLDFDGLDDIVLTFLEETGTASVDAVSLGVAGPVTGLIARMTNVPWVADASRIGERLGNPPVRLLNDLEAMASAVPVLEPDELAVLQGGTAVAGGNAALIAAGTGLGEALLHNVNGQFVPSASEAGHADFAARTPRELAFVEEMSRVHARVDNERVISGPGLVNLFRFTHGTQDLRHACRALGPEVDPVDMPAAISEAALEGRCEQCGEALEMFVEAYGAEAGNLALKLMGRGGVWIGGGMAPNILPHIRKPIFMDAFLTKGRMQSLLETMSVRLILNDDVGLLGAARHAAT